MARAPPKYAISTITQAALPDVHLMLLSDVSGFVPADVFLDFEVKGAELGDDKFKIGVLIDNTTLTVHSSDHCEVRDLAAGYHVLRAFVLDRDGLCVKSASAYVEAEFFAVSARPIGDKGFMFGQPSICHLSPRQPIRMSQPTAVFDMFVNNCAVSEEAHGFSIRIYINDEAVATVNSWSAISIRGPWEVGAKVNVRTVLVNPANEEMLTPAFHSQTHTLTVVA